MGKREDAFVPAYVQKLPDAFPLPAGQDTGRQGGFVPIDQKQTKLFQALMKTMWCSKCNTYLVNLRLMMPRRSKEKLF